MSSILDALKKLEEEKAAKAAGPDVEVPFTPESAAELFNRPTRNDDDSARPAPWMLVGGGALGVLLLVAIVTMLTSGRGEKATDATTIPVQVATHTPVATPVPAPAAQPAPQPAVPAKPPVAVQVPAPAPQPVAVVPTPKPAPAPAPQPVAMTPPPAPAPQPTAVETPLPEPAPTVVAIVVPPPAPAVVEQPVAVNSTPQVAPEPEPAPRPEPVPQPAPRPAPPVPAPRVEVPQPPSVIPKPGNAPPKAAAQKQAAEDIDITVLPRLGRSDFGRFGLDGIALNMLREPSKDRPHGLAIINLNKVYPGELIQGSQARLIGVTRGGIGVEIESTGEQYFIEQ